MEPAFALAVINVSIVVNFDVKRMCEGEGDTVLVQTSGVKDGKE